MAFEEQARNGTEPLNELSIEHMASSQFEQRERRETRDEPRTILVRPGKETSEDRWPLDHLTNGVGVEKTKPVVRAVHGEHGRSSVQFRFRAPC